MQSEFIQSCREATCNWNPVCEHFSVAVSSESLAHFVQLEVRDICRVTYGSLPTSLLCETHKDISQVHHVREDVLRRHLHVNANEHTQTHPGATRVLLCGTCVALFLLLNARCDSPALSSYESYTGVKSQHVHWFASTRLSARARLPQALAETSPEVEGRTVQGQMTSPCPCPLPLLLSSVSGLSRVCVLQVSGSQRIRSSTSLLRIKTR